MAKVNAVPFHEKEYWESRFENETHFEWLMTWRDIHTKLEPYLTDKSQQILHLGCGNSELAFELADDGYTNIVNLDYAENVIEHMKLVTQTKQGNYNEISWHVGDCMNNLTSYLPNEGYSIIIDKSLADTIACGDDDDQSRMKTLAKEILSAAKPNALWFSISFSGEREFYIDNHERSHWETVERIPSEIHQPNDRPGAPAIYYYIYVNRKVALS